MPKEALKLVLSFESEDQGFQPSEHNLSAEQAIDLVRHIASEGRTAKVIDQTSRHKTLDLTRCRPCKKSAEEATYGGTQPSGDEQKQKHQEGEPESE